MGPAQKAVELRVQKKKRGPRQGQETEPETGQEPQPVSVEAELVAHRP
jgi:hypothetical protein